LRAYICGKYPFHLVINFHPYHCYLFPDVRNNHSPAPDKTKMTVIIEPEKIKFWIKSADSSTILNLQHYLPGKNPDLFKC
jgi:hypothetical protein